MSAAPWSFRRRVIHRSAALAATLLTAAALVVGPAALTAAASTDPAATDATSDTATDTPANAATPGDDKTTWSVEPATEKGPDGRVSFRLAVDPGGKTSDFVTISNFSGHPATFDVYASDGVVTADGQFDLLPDDAEPVDGGAWIVLGKGSEAGPRQTVEVAAQSSATIPFTLTVPADATPGDHPAGIVASLQRAASDGSQVTFDTRVGARVHLRVSGDLAPALALHDVKTTYIPSWNPFAPGEVRVDYVVANTGNVRLGADTSVAGSGPFGWNSRAAVAPATREVLPRQEAAGSVVIDGVWPLGRLSGDVTTVPLVVGEDVVDVELADAGSSYAVWAMPWVQLAIVLVLVGLVLAAVRARRRREARTQARIAAAVEASRPAPLDGGTVADGDAGLTA